jgi:predicted CXXCH cytochrome family protein
MTARQAAVRTSRHPLQAALLAGTLLAWAILAGWHEARATHQPPHDSSFGVECLSCHVPHGSAGNVLTRADTVPTLCMTCHNPGDQASDLPFSDSDQAFPGQLGTSHRFDSGPSGHVEAELSNTSTGSVRSGGDFTGRIEKRFDIVIAAGGEVGTATFDWSDGAGGGSGLTTGADVVLSDGLQLRFENGDTPPSFVAGDRYTLFVRADLRLPVFNDAADFEDEMARRLAHLGERFPDRSFDSTYGKVVCTVCHDPHKQDHAPFDPTAPADPNVYVSPGGGRHLQRRDNDQNQMCVICHEARNVSSSGDGSHPVATGIPVTGDFRIPAGLPLSSADQVVCLTCHDVHVADSGGANGGLGDGYLLRDPDGNPAAGEIAIGDLCLQCHTLAGDGSQSTVGQLAGSHFDLGSGALWPGGQYGSSVPAHPAQYRGYCVNCHWPHGWPDDADMAIDYPRLWVERYDIAADGSDPADAEDLCFTCHDGDPATSNVRADIIKGANDLSANPDAPVFHHPVQDTEQDIAAGRSVECVDCHNPHRATAADRHAGVEGVDVTGSVIPAGSRPLAQQELCWKCHGDSYNAARSNTSNKRDDFQPGNSAYHPVVQAGRNQSQNLADQLAGAGLDTASTIRCTDCHNSDNFSGGTGVITDSPAVTVGPHGSGFAPILRAQFGRDYTGSGNWNNANAALCFRCHDQNTLLARRRGDGARTNFYDDINGNDNLHWVHLVDRNTTHSCMSCHFDIHSNVSADNTQYRVDGVLYPDNRAVSGARIKTHMVNFAPDVAPYSADGVSRARPEWWLSTSTRERRCYLACHGETMAGESGDGGRRAQYRPPAGDETSWSY